MNKNERLQVRLTTVEMNWLKVQAGRMTVADYVRQQLNIAAADLRKN